MRRLWRVVALALMACAEPPTPAPLSETSRSERDDAQERGRPASETSASNPESVASNRESMALAAASSWAILSVVTAGDRTFAVTSSGSCDPSDYARSGTRLGEDARLIAVDAELPRREYTLFSDQGICTATSAASHMLVFPRSDTHGQTRNCPIAFELVGCSGPTPNAYLLLAVEGRRSVRWTRAVSAQHRDFGRDGSGARSFETLGIANPWPEQATRISVSETDFGRSVRAVRTNAELPGGGYGSLVLVVEDDQLRWRERNPGDLEAHISIDGIGFLLFTEEWGGWRLRAVHTGESWSGDWPRAFYEDYGN